MTETLTGAAPKVSVVSVTYNHEAYIREALDGFVAQQTNFPVEIVIADDASTDATPAIIREYADRYPQLFRPILRSENIGVHANFADTLSAARGDYIALCEGTTSGPIRASSPSRSSSSTSIPTQRCASIPCE